jgi:intracellular sulfur oxidation DsrE/DsrF family protein
MAEKQQFTLTDLFGMLAIAATITFLWTDNARLKQEIQSKELDNAACGAQLERQKAESEGLIKGVLLRR